MTALLLFLLAAVSHVDLVNENYEIPANDWRYVPRPLTHEPAMADCIFQANRQDAQVRLVLLSREDLNLWRLGRDHDEISTTPAGSHGALRLSVHDPETYLAVENRGAQPVQVRLRVFLEQPSVRYLSTARRTVVILISFGVFAAMVSASARKLWKAARPNS